MGVMSNRQRRQMLKTIKAKPHHPARDEVMARAARTAPARPEPEMRDGLQWLIDKGRLTARRRRAANVFRVAYRAVECGAPLKSCLDGGVGGGSAGPGLHHDFGYVSLTQAKRDLFMFRWVVLGGQPDMLTVMDGVCGLGHTLRGLTGETTESRIDRRAGVLEAILMVALDLMATHMEAREAGGVP